MVTYLKKKSLNEYFVIFVVQTGICLINYEKLSSDYIYKKLSTVESLNSDRTKCHLQVFDGYFKFGTGPNINIFL